MCPFSFYLYLIDNDNHSQNQRLARLVHYARSMPKKVYVTETDREQEKEIKKSLAKAFLSCYYVYMKTTTKELFMLFTFSIYFLLFSVASVFFLLITSDTTGYNAEAKERMDALNDAITVVIAPIIAAVACVLFILVNVYGV